jgi:hypothetical protein
MGLCVIVIVHENNIVTGGILDTSVSRGSKVSVRLSNDFPAFLFPPLPGKLIQKGNRSGIS